LKKKAANRLSIRRGNEKEFERKAIIFG